MVRKKKFWKNTFRQIRKEYSRFISMIGIVLLGVGVITGLLVTTPNMQTSVDDYYKTNNTADIFMKSSVGFNVESLDIIKNLDNIKDVSGHNERDLNVDYVNYENKESKLTTLLYEVDLTKTNYINQLTLVEGKINNLASNEILVEQSDYYLTPIQIGEKLLISEVINELTNETIKVEYIVAGIVSNPWYFSKEAERTISGAKKIKAIVYKQIDLAEEIYTDLYITVDYKTNAHTFSSKYKEDTKLVIEAIKNNQDELIQNQKNLMIANIAADDIYRNEKIEIINNYEEDLYVFGRNANVSFQTFDEFVMKVDSIAKIFPIFFLLVAALVVLTTMTRMVEEERLQIGILRGLGYSKGDIYAKYIIYALLVGVIGTLIGYAAGFRLLPTVIYGAFDNVFFLPPLNLYVYSTLNIVVMFVMVISIFMATIVAVKKTLKQNTAALLLPRAPKKGKRIFLEKMPFIWKRLKFKYKSSLRNIFRYPKHLLMTVLGVAGSLALVFTGLGLNNAIKTITKTQYDVIYNYDFAVNVAAFNSDLELYLENSHNDDYLAFMERGEHLTSADGNDTFYIDVVILEEYNDMDEFILLRNRKTNKKLELNDNGVIISEQIARYLKLDIGDEFKIDGQSQTLTVSGITENYINSKIYMTKQFYDDTYGFDLLAEQPDKSKYKVNKVITNNINNLTEETLTSNLLNIDGVLGVDFQSGEIEANDRLLNQVTIIVVILVGAAAMLAIIVVYNLANVNISEREKEIATLKVLGYKQSEVSGYVFREIFIMTSFGIILGIGLGFLMHSYIINAIDTPNVMMGRNLEWYTYVVSIGLTLVFTFVVQFLMYFKIKKINMIEAMKEV